MGGYSIVISNFCNLSNFIISKLLAEGTKVIHLALATTKAERELGISLFYGDLTQGNYHAEYIDNSTLGLSVSVQNVLAEMELIKHKNDALTNIIYVPNLVLTSSDNTDKDIFFSYQKTVLLSDIVETLIEVQQLTKAVTGGLVTVVYPDRDSVTEIGSSKLVELSESIPPLITELAKQKFTGRVSLNGVGVVDEARMLYAMEANLENQVLGSEVLYAVDMFNHGTMRGVSGACILLAQSAIIDSTGEQTMVF